MGVYLPNMDVPRKCIRCPFCFWGECYANDKHDVSKSLADAVRDPSCPIIEKEDEEK